MNKSFFIIPALIILIQCGGTSGKLGQEPKEILIDFTDPVVSFSLSASDYEYRLIVYSETADGLLPVYGPVELASYNADTNTYSARADDLLFGSYYAEVWLVKVTGEGDGLPISKTGFTLNLTENEQAIGLGGPEWDDSAFDEDADGLSNQEELSLATDPYEEDSDGDGVSDSVDAFPLDGSEAYDFDGDGFGDSHDSDIDNDGLTNTREAEIGTDPIRPDSDFDTLLDGLDNCPLDSNLSQDDLDADGIGDECDSDRDGDGVSDEAENSRGSSPILIDTDGDGAFDAVDLFPTNASDSLDNDNDGVGNNADTDDDNDGVTDSAETVSGLNPNVADTDGDGVSDKIDNCGLLVNPGQSDNEHDGFGDDCDDDDDNDSLTDSEETVIGEDGFITNARSADSDGDGFKDNLDNCPNDDNITQADGDTDGFGAACDCDDANVAINQLSQDDPDPQTIDANCDGIDGDRYESIFVSVSGTFAAYQTSYGSPTSDLQGALVVAAESGQVVLISEGDFNIGELSVPDGISVYGGYSTTFLDRDVLAQSHETRLINPGLDDNGAVLTLSELNGGVRFGGITFMSNSQESLQTGLFIENSAATIENCEFPGFVDADTEYLLMVSDSEVNLRGNRFYGQAVAASTAIFAENSELNFINNLLDMGDADHTRGLELNEVTGVISNNTIDGGRHSLGSSYGVIFSGGTQTFTNNLFITQNDRNQSGLFCSGLTPDDEVTLENNVFLRMTSRPFNYPAFIQCDGTALYSNSELEGSDVLNADGNIVESNVSETILTSYVDSSNLYAPVTGSPLIDAGINTNAESDGSVTYDLQGTSRVLDSYDIGAIEL